MAQTDARVEAAGILLGLGAVLLGGGVVFHGPLAADTGDQMTTIAGASARWAVVHWVAAAGLSFLAMAGVIVLAAGSRLTGNRWTTIAWAVLTLGALWTMTTAIAETTAVTDAAIAGDRAMFETWWAFSEGKAQGFAFAALAVVSIAYNEVRSATRAPPEWASWIGGVAALVSFLAWALWSWLGIGPVSLAWVVSTIVMCLWLAWFGVALSRSGAR